MPSYQNYVDKVGPVVAAAWLNPVDNIKATYDLWGFETLAGSVLAAKGSGFDVLASARYTTQANMLVTATYVLANQPTDYLTRATLNGFGAFGNGPWNTNNAAADPPHIFEVTTDNSTCQVARMNSYGAAAFGAGIHWCKYRGTASAPTVIKNTDFFMSFGTRGYDGVSLSQSAGAFQALATEDWSATANGMRWHFEAAKPGTTAINRVSVMDIDYAGIRMNGTYNTNVWNTNFRVVEFSVGAAVRGNVSTGADIALSSNSYFDTAYKYGLTNAAGLYQISANVHVWSGAASGTAGTAITFTEFARLDANGNFQAGANGVAAGRDYHNLLKANAQASTILLVRSETTANSSLEVAAVSGSAFNAAAASLKVGNNTSTSRSINAGGTVNASGADYAEYMTKADDCGVVAKGDVVGVNAEGKLTDKWSKAVTFVVKSTNPSYVGGDTWGGGLKPPEAPGFEVPRFEGTQHPGPVPQSPESPEDAKLHAVRAKVYAATLEKHEKEFQVYETLVKELKTKFETETLPKYKAELKAHEAQLEAFRQKVDRIAFSGQVPVNITTANPGDYIIPVNNDTDHIALVAVSSPTFDQYLVSVGKVVALEADGRARIIVKPV